MRTAERKMELQLTAPALSWENRTMAFFDTASKLLNSLINRNAVTRLAEMDDHQLSDIGLVRQDVTDALDLGLLEDPSFHLARASKMNAKSRFSKLRR